MGLGERLKVLFSDVWGFLAPFLRLFLTDAGRLLASSAMEVVTEIAETMLDKDGEEKRRAAFIRISDDLRSGGIRLGASVINAAIEAAVQRLRADSGAGR
jgi:hypothetical protein